MLTWQKGSRWLRDALSKAIRHPNFQRAGWGLFFFLVAVLVLVSNFLSGGFSLKEGQISPADISSPRNIVYVDEAETERLREEAARRVEKVYREDKQVAALLDEKIRGIYARIRELREADLSAAERAARLRDFLGQATGAPAEKVKSLPGGALEALLQRSEEELAGLEARTRNFLQEELKYRLTEESLPEARERLAERVALSELNQPWQPVVSFILTETIRPNLILDQEAYARRVAEARNQVPPVQRTIQAGQIIVRKGDPVDAGDLAVLRQLGLLRTRAIWPVLLGAGLFVLLLGGLTFFYLYQFRRDFLRHDQHLLLYGLLFTLTLLVAKGITVLKISNQPEIANLVGYLVPLAGGAMLITVLLDAGLAVFSAFVASILVGIMMGGQLSFVIAGLVGSLAGIYSISSLSDRSGLIRGGIYVSLANAAVILVLGLLDEVGASTLAAGIGMGVLNGFLSSVMTLGCLPYLETAFGITSSVRLLELANPNQPLLKRLLMEAPGTYHHSILVGNLAEAAAQAVHADPLLVRVGSYYHDIGKLKRPYFFIENQVTKENPHEKIAPSLSTLIITSHVKDGLELAREHRLPRDVMAIIEQHHGTSLVAYFYQRALESDRPELVTEADFRYDAVKPQSKEAALVMLADSVEAAIRALQKPTPGRLEGLTRRIIKEKLHDGQLDECDLTFKDLNRIAAAFVRVLTGIFHSRIEYPETVISELERRRSRGAVVNQ